jgi:hypothetical protein
VGGHPSDDNNRLPSDSTYSYVKFTKCAGHKASFTAYSDSSCLRPQYKSKLNLRPEGMGKCTLQEDDYYYGERDDGTYCALYMTTCTIYDYYDDDGIICLLAP